MTPSDELRAGEVGYIIAAIKEISSVKVGDTVLFGKYSGTEIKLEGADYLIVREEEILAIIEGAPAAV